MLSVHCCTPRLAAVKFHAVGPCFAAETEVEVSSTLKLHSKFLAIGTIIVVSLRR